MLLAAISIAGACLIRVGVVLGEQGGEGLTVVTSFYPMQIAALNVAGDCPGVTVECLSEPQTGCLHDYQLTPQDMILLSRADVFVVNGGGIESFLPLVERERPDLTVIRAGEDIFGEGSHSYVDSVEGASPLPAHSAVEETHQHEEENAHAWMGISCYMRQVEAICRGLVAADPEHAAIYEGNRDAYLDRIAGILGQATELKGLAEGTRVVLFHEAYEYLAAELGLSVEGVLNLDEERQVSAGETAQLASRIRERSVGVIFAEEQYGAKMGRAMEQETGCRVYYLNTLVRGQVTEDAWLDGMAENLRVIREAIEGAEQEDGGA